MELELEPELICMRTTLHGYTSHAEALLMSSGTQTRSTTVPQHQ